MQETTDQQRFEKGKSYVLSFIIIHIIAMLVNTMLGQHPNVASFLLSAIFVAGLCYGLYHGYNAIRWVLIVLFSLGSFLTAVVLFQALGFNLMILVLNIVRLGFLLAPETTYYFAVLKEERAFRKQ